MTLCRSYGVFIIMERQVRLEGLGEISEQVCVERKDLFGNDTICDVLWLILIKLQLIDMQA